MIGFSLLISQFSCSRLDAKDKVNIFFLDSYHVGYPWSDNLTRGVREVFDSSGRIIQLQIGYMFINSSVIFPSFFRNLNTSARNNSSSGFKPTSFIT